MKNKPTKILQNPPKSASSNFEERIICVQSHGKKHKITILNDVRNSSKQMETISSAVSIPLPKLKLVAKGKQIAEENLLDFIFIKKCNVFMVSFQKFLEF